MGEPSDGNACSSRHRTLTQELAARYVSDLESPSSAEVRALVHALEVHEMELRAQNDQLRATQKDLEAKIDDLHDAEEALRFEHARLAKIFDAMDDGVYIADEQFVIRYANPALVREFGPVVGQRCFQCLAERQQPCESCQNADILRGRHVHAEWECPRTSRAYDAIGTPLPNADGTVWRLQVLRDITERKQMENARNFLLQVGRQPAGEDFFRSLARYLAQSLDMDFVCIDRLAGDQLTAKTVAVYDDGQFQDNIEYALKDTPCGEVVAGDVCCIAAGVRQQFPRDSVLATLRAESYVGVIIRNAEGKPTGLIAVIGRKPLADSGIARRVLELVALRAATELERAEAVETLRASEQRYRSYIDLTGQIGWTTDAGGEVDDMPAWRRFTGQTLQEVKGWGWTNALHPDDVARTVAVWRKALADRTRYEIEYRIRRSDAEYRHFLVRGVPLLASDGTVREWVGTCIDITDRWRATQLSESRLRLSRIDADKTMDELLQATIDEGERLTDSQAGFLHLVESDQRTLRLQCWSSNTVANLCHAQGKRRHYDLDQAGVWADALRQRCGVIHNDYASIPGRKGMPEGHAPVVREMVVPVFQGERVVAILGVGNKQAEYRPEDMQVLSDLAGFAWDLVIRKQVEERLQLAMRGAMLGTWDWDFREMMVDARGREILGLDPVAEYRYDRCWECIHPEDRQRVEDARQQALREGTELLAEYRVCWPDGTLRWVLCCGRGFCDESGQPMRLAGTLMDITAGKEAEEAARQANARVSAVLESITDAFFSLDREFRVTYINGEAERVLGKSRAEMLSRCLWELFPEAVGSRFHREYEQALAQGDTARFEEYYPPMETWFSVRAYPFAGGLSVFFTDITDRKLAEAALARASEELVRSNRDLQQFASVASHDLQAPLRMVTGFLGLLKDRYAANLDDKAREFVGFAVDGAKRMSQLIKDLLDYARVGSRGGEPKPMKLQDVVDRVLADRLASMEECQATLTHDVLPPIVADEGQMVQLLSNLVGNAIKYRLPDRPPVIHIGAERGQGHWRISVRDNGIGIEPKDAERVFEIFQRLHAQGTYEGTGIGLAICKRIVERHGGVISLESRPGQGSTFWFTIPDRT